MLNTKPIGYALSLVLISSALQGCVAMAIAPTALTLAAEGVSVHSTGQTITENLKDAILKSKAETAEEDAAPEVELASRDLAPLPPRKPEPPKRAPLMITSEANTIGNFMN